MRVSVQEAISLVKMAVVDVGMQYLDKHRFQVRPFGDEDAVVWTSSIKNQSFFSRDRDRQNDFLDRTKKAAKECLSRLNLKDIPEFKNIVDQARREAMIYYCVLERGYEADVEMSTVSQAKPPILAHEI